MNINEKAQLFYERVIANEIQNYRYLVDNHAAEQALRLQGQVLKRLLNEFNNFNVETYPVDEL